MKHENFAIDTLQKPKLPIPKTLSTLVSPEQWSVLTKQVFPNAKDPNAIGMGLLLANQLELDLFRKHVDVVNFGGGEAPFISEDGLIALAEQTGSFGGWGEERFGPTVEIQVGKEKLTGYEWVEVDVYKIINGERVLCRGTRVFLEEEVKLRKDPVTREEAGPNAFWGSRPKSQLLKNARRRTLNANFQHIARAAIEKKFSPLDRDEVSNNSFTASEVEPEAKPKNTQAKKPQTKKQDIVINPETGEAELPPLELD